jgi:hypothetical protein
MHPPRRSILTPPQSAHLTASVPRCYAGQSDNGSKFRVAEGRFGADIASGQFITIKTGGRTASV